VLGFRFLGSGVRVQRFRFLGFEGSPVLEVIGFWGSGVLEVIGFVGSRVLRCLGSGSGFRPQLHGSQTFEP
jgi:hypothetical protein